MCLEVGRAIQPERGGEGGELVLVEHRPRPNRGRYRPDFRQAAVRARVPPAGEHTFAVRDAADDREEGLDAGPSRMVGYGNVGL